MSHDRSNNRSSFFESYSHILSAEPNIDMDNSNKAVKSPWKYMRSGYSSVSPPGTGSSGSSTTSQCYGRSPENLSVDSLLNSLMHVVNGDKFSTPRNIRYPPSSNFAGTSQCRDCTDTPCDTCLTTRQSKCIGINRLADHGGKQNTLIDLPNSPIMQMSSSPTITSAYCEVHRDVQRLYCQTCSRSLCRECEPYSHHGHVTIHLMEAIEGATIQANQVLHEAKLGVVALKEDLDAVQMAAETLEHKARQATTDVMVCVRKLASALETREKELLGRIEKARVLKFAALKSRDEGLREGIARLSKAIDRLGDAMEMSTLTSNPLDLLITKDMASAEIFQIQHARQNLPPPEESWISFTGSEGNVLHSIANLGSIVLNNPGPIGDRRALRGRGGSPHNTLTPSPTLSQLLVPCGRPIPLSNFPVKARPLRNHSVTTKTSKIIGNNGEADDVLCRPWGVACDHEGNIIVADRSNNRIQIYKQDGSLVRSFGSHGTNLGEFDRPAGVAVDARRRIIVADKDNHRIQIFSIEGTFMLCFGEKGSECGQFNYPWDVAANEACQIVVSDTRNHRVQLFSPQGVFLRKYGYEASPSMWKHFDSPRGVAFNTDGNIVTTDFNNHRMVVIDADFMSARVLTSDVNSNTRQFLRPQGLVIDDEGNIVIADSRNHRIQIFDASGTLKWTFGSYGKGPDEMDRPSGIALCPDGRIAVVDFGNNRVLLI